MNAESKRLAEGFAARLREAITDPEYGLPSTMSLTQQARALGLSSKSLLSKWLQAGTAKPDYRMIKAACLRLQIRPEWLCENDGPKRQQQSEGTTPKLIRGARTMTLKQQQDFMHELLENVPHLFRSAWIDNMTRTAIENGYIERWPDVMIADHQADEAIEAAKRRKERPTRSDHPESESESD